MRLEGKVAVITGAGSGMGLAMANGSRPKEPGRRR
jgi:NAD(P)-dependent dehydrogenase (short-subunit alcohol dehydrogenase family)